MTGQSRQVRLVAPDEPPRLTPGAARVLLRILLKATKNTTETGEPECDSHTPQGADEV